MGKEVKTNAMRILDKNKIPYEIINYECDEFIDGLHTAEATGAPVEQSFKTLVMQGKSKQYYVFVLPIAEEVDLKVAAKTVGEKSVEMIHVKDITAIATEHADAFSHGRTERGNNRFCVVGAVVYHYIFSCRGDLSTCTMLKWQSEIRIFSFLP